MLDEHQGRAVLKEVFEQHGLTITEEFTFDVAGFRVVLDGYDPERRVGYEYVTTADGDREELHDEVVRELDRLNETGLLKLFMIDERFIADAEVLRQAASAFLEEMLP